MSFRGSNADVTSFNVIRKFELRHLRRDLMRSEVEINDNCAETSQK